MSDKPAPVDGGGHILFLVVVKYNSDQASRSSQIVIDYRGIKHDIRTRMNG